jgi:3-oxoacyl-[acyl-carrier protein] reductase
MKLKGRIALVTGAGSGMGKAISLLFAEQGAKIVAVDVNELAGMETVQTINANGGQGLFLYADLSKSTDIYQMANEALSTYGKIDIICNCAGILDDYKSATQTDEELWDKILNVNLKAPYLISKLVIPKMIDEGKGNIINIASISAMVAGGGGISYTASKHGLIGLTKQLAYDYGSKGIRANAISPGAIETGMTKDIFSNPDLPVMELVNSLPAGRHAQAYEVANLALFLASDDSDFIHGANFVIDGGWTIK